MTERTVQLMPLHSSQREVYSGLAKRTVIRCGRRWGKSALIEVVAGYDALRGQRVGIFAPDYKRVTEMYANLTRTLKPATKSSNKTELTIELITGGVIDIWTCLDPNAGRSRKYHRAIVDEAGFIPGLEEIFTQSIEPTLLDYGGSAIVCGTPKDITEDNFFYKLCTNKIASENWPVVWTEFHQPTSSNPFLPAEEVANLKRTKPPLVYQQEYMAEFVNWTGESLFKATDLLVDGHGVDYPQHCEFVFATIDTAVKDGAENDGTGVIYWAINKYGSGAPLTILDYELLQIRSDLQVSWIPSIFARLETLAKETKARYGSIMGIYIEDKQSGQMLLQHGERAGWNTHAIPAEFTQIGKNGRAQIAMGPVFEQKVKLSQYAFDKVVEFKGSTRNHLLTQVTGFRLGDKEAYKRPDDLADCFFYGVMATFEGEAPVLY